MIGNSIVRKKKESNIRERTKKNRNQPKSFLQCEHKERYTTYISEENKTCSVRNSQCLVEENEKLIQFQKDIPLVHASPLFRFDILLWFNGLLKNKNIEFHMLT